MQLTDNNSKLFVDLTDNNTISLITIQLVTRNAIN